MIAFDAGPTGIFGKARHQAEFLRVHSGSPSLGLFDSWLTETVEWAAARSGPAWPQAFAQGAIHAFVFQPHSLPSNHVVCGVLGPSADSAGRQFPLVVAAPLNVAAQLLASPQLLPFVLEAFWANASQLLGSVQATPLSELHSAAAALLAEADLSADDAESLYANWSAELPMAELRALLGPPFDTETASLALRLLAATAEPFRGTERPRTPLSFRLPLGQAAGAALCFWLDLVRRSMRWRSTIPSFVWSHDGTSGSALLHLGHPPRSTLSALFLPAGDHDEICDLTLPPPASLAESLPELGPGLTRALANEGCSVHDFLASVDAF